MHSVKTNRKIGLKLVLVALIVALAATAVFGLAGCVPNGKDIEVDGWTLYRYNGRNNSTRGQVNILSANSDELVVDGVLNIPAKIGKYKIHGFGKIEADYGQDNEYHFSIIGDTEIERIVLAAELKVDHYFWQYFSRFPQPPEGLQHVELLTNSFERIISFGGTNPTYIIPDGSTQNFIDRLESLYDSSESFDFIEKSEWLANQK